MKFSSASATLALLSLLIFGLIPSAHAVGSWAPVTRQAPNSIGTMLLLTDGTIMAQGADNGGVSSNWYRLTPDAGGSYANGTWTQLASMHQTRLYFASVVMRNGQIFVAGGEYSDAGSDTNTAEIYDPPTNTWTVVAGPSGWPNIGDAPITSLADGRLLLGSIGSGQSALFNYSAGTWANAANKIHDGSSTEESWALLPNGSVLTVDCTSQPDFAEQYVPASNAWLDAGQTPAGHHVVDNSSAEVGPAVLLPNGNVLYVGATGHTALYSTTTTSWLGGPDYPKVLDVDNRDSGSGTSNSYNTQVTAQAKDAPGCLMVNGKVLTVVGPTGYNSDANTGNGGYPSGQYFFEYDPTGGTGALTAAPFPGGSVPLSPTFVARMLALPNGQVLFSNFSSQLYVYTPDSGPDPSWAPVITGVTANGDGSYQVQGTQFNGLSQASAYGDDGSEATNYPLVRLTDSSGKVAYARTFNHSTMGVATGNTPVSTNFLAPSALANGTYQMQIVANGIASAPVSFTYSRLTTPPPAPTGLTASPGVGQVTLNWTASARATSYDIFRGTTPGGESPTPIAATGGPSFIDTGLTAGVTYYYRVNALNSYGASGFSNEASALSQPLPPGVILPTSEQTGYSWKYMLTTPPSNWYATAFNDSAWVSGLAGFGTINGNGAVSRTPWTSTPGDIWIRRHFTISGSVPPSAQFRVFYDEGCEIYINGVQAASTTGYATSYVAVPMNSAGQAALQVGDNVIAVHCTQTSGGQYIDVGIQAPPAAPTNLSAAGGSGQVTLNWAVSSGAVSYNIYRGTSANGEGATPVKTAVTTAAYTDTGLTNGTTYFYKVTAVNSVGESGFSNEAVATPGSAPSGLVNGSFEMPSVGSAGYQYNPTGGTWTFTGNSGLQSNGSAWGAANAPDGTQTAFLQGNPNQSSTAGTGVLGSLSQNVNFATAGTYALTFQAAQRWGQVQPLKFSVDGVQVGGLLTPASSSFNPVTVTFSLSSAGTHTLTLSATDGTRDASTFVDQVSLAPSLVPVIANASFETPSVGSASYQYNPAGGAWAFSGNSGLQSNGSIWFAPNAPDGTQTAFLQGNPNQGAGALGSISQSVNFAGTGNYALTFQAARRQGQVQPLKFSVDGVQVGGLLTPVGNSFSVLTSAVFTIGAAGSHTLTLSATDNSADLSVFVDQFSLSQK